MKEQIDKSLGFLKTTAIGGLLILLPLIVVLGFLGYGVSAVVAAYEPLQKFELFKTPAGVAILFVVTLGIVLGLCFSAGLVARRAIVQQFSQTVEKKLMLVFPKYAIYKDLLAGNIGGGENMPTLTPVSIRGDEMIRLGFEADRLPGGLVVVYLPGSPDSWIGTLALVSPDRVQPLDVPFNDALGIFERLGRDSSQQLAAVETAGRPEVGSE